jgi:hypothetical protein
VYHKPNDPRNQEIFVEFMPELVAKKEREKVLVYGFFEPRVG